jgi:hypothetical protein
MNDLISYIFGSVFSETQVELVKGQLDATDSVDPVLMGFDRLLAQMVGELPTGREDPGLMPQEQLAEQESELNASSASKDATPSVGQFLDASFGTSTRIAATCELHEAPALAHPESPVKNEQTGALGEPPTLPGDFEWPYSIANIDSGAAQQAEGVGSDTVLNMLEHSMSGATGHAVEVDLILSPETDTVPELQKDEKSGLVNRIPAELFVSQGVVDLEASNPGSQVYDEHNSTDFVSERNLSGVLRITGSNGEILQAVELSVSKYHDQLILRVRDDGPALLEGSASKLSELLNTVNNDKRSGPIEITVERVAQQASPSRVVNAVPAHLTMPSELNYGSGIADRGTGLRIADHTDLSSFRDNSSDFRDGNPKDSQHDSRVPARVDAPALAALEFPKLEELSVRKQRGLIALADHSATDAGGRQFTLNHSADGMTLASRQPQEFIRSSFEPVRFEVKMPDSGSKITEISTFKVALKPESLGNIRVNLVVTDNHLTARLDVDSMQAKHAVESNLPSLREALSHHGVKVDSFVVTLSAWGDPDRHSQRRTETPGSKQRFADAEDDSQDEAVANIAETIGNGTIGSDYPAGSLNLLA